MFDVLVVAQISISTVEFRSVYQLICVDSMTLTIVRQDSAKRSCFLEEIHNIVSRLLGRLLYYYGM